MTRLHLAVPLLCVPLALAQTPVPATQASPVITANSTVVLVPAMVTTKKGEPVFTLTAKDFTLTDDGIAQPLALEEDNGGEPLALIVAIQTGGAGARQLPKYSNLPLLVDNLVGNVPHKVAIVSFDSVPKLLQDFTSDSDPVGSALRNLTAGDDGAAILDTIGYAVDILKTQPIQYRRAILLISETLDRPGAGGSHISLQDALREISDTNTAIYSLGFSSIRSESLRRSGNAFQTSTPGPRHGCMAKPDGPQSGDASLDPSSAGGDSTSAGIGASADDASATSPATPSTPSQDASGPAKTPGRTPGQVANQTYDCLALLAPPLALAKMAALAGIHGLERNVPETVAQMTGGEYFAFSNAKTLERDLETISNHVPNRYMLSFQPQSPHPGLHSVKLSLKSYPNLELSARNSYWVDSDTNTSSHP